MPVRSAQAPCSLTLLEIQVAGPLSIRQISGAAFDVTTSEPPPLDHPFSRIMDRPNFILTPHVACASREAVQSLADQLIETVNVFWRGQPRNLVRAV